MEDTVAATPTPAPVQYIEEDLVYVDPDTRTVVGRVEWLPNGRPKALPMKMQERDDDEEEKGVKGKRPPRRQRFYPWGTYRSMKRIYKLEGKQPKQESQKTLDDVMEKALREPFWD